MQLNLTFRRSVASLVFVLYALFAVLGSALVRCQEADGTSSIELRSTGCCVPSVQPYSGFGIETAASSEQEQDCDGCTDQSLADTLSAAAARSSAAATLKAPDAPAPSTAPLVPAGPVVFGAPGRWARQMRAPHPPPCLAAIRSVIILV